MHIENKVKLLRQDLGITQEDLAHAVSVSRQTIIAIEKGNYTPSLVLAMELSVFFKTTVEKIFTLNQ